MGPLQHNAAVATDFTGFVEKRKYIRERDLHLVSLAEMEDGLAKYASAVRYHLINLS